MRVLVMGKATKETESGTPPDLQAWEAMHEFNEELVKAGILLTGEGLYPSSKGARVRFSGKSCEVIDGPFAETKELVAGFSIWQVKSLDEAIEWVKRCPNLHNGEWEVEIRQIFDPADFAELEAERQEKEERMRADLAAKK